MPRARAKPSRESSAPQTRIWPQMRCSRRRHMRPKPRGRIRYGTRKGMRRAVVCWGKVSRRSIWPQPK